MKKKFLVSCMVSVAALCLSVGTVGISANAQNQDIISELNMVAGASIRLPKNNTTSASECGIRYAFTMSETEYNGLIANVGDGKTYSDVKFGVFIASANYNIAGYEIADESHVMGESAIYYWQVGQEEDGTPIFNVENPDKSKMKQIICSEGTAMVKKDDGNMYFYGSVVNMKDENISRDYVGVGYVKYTSNAETHYQFATGNNNVRSMEYVAREAYENKPDLREGLVNLYLNKVKHNCEVVTPPVAHEVILTDGAQALVTAGVADEYANMQYSLDNETWSNEIPTTAEVGCYTVYYKAASKTSFDVDSEVQSLSVTASKKTDTVTLSAASVSEVKDSTGIIGFTGTYDSVPLGRYDIGDVLEFRFSGQNIPNLGLFVDKGDVSPVGGEGKDTGIFVQTSGYTSTFNNRMYFTGPFLLDAGNKTAYDNIGYNRNTECGKNIQLEVDHSETGNVSLFGIAQLSAEQEYVYKIATVASSKADKFIINATLYKVSGTTVEVVKSLSKTIEHRLNSLENRYAIVYGAGKEWKENITFTYSVNPEKETQATVGTLSLNAARITETKNAENKVVGYSGTYDYYGLGSYNVGDVLEFSFTGKNIPNVGLFVNKNGVNPIGGGTENTGLFLQTSGHGTNTFSKRLYICGPFLADAGSADAYNTIELLKPYKYDEQLGKNKELGVDITTNASVEANTSIFGIDFLTEGTNYVYSITTSTSATGKVVITTRLYTVENDVRTLVGEFSKDTTHYLNSLENRYAVVYGAGDFYGKTIEFSYKVLRNA